MIEHQASLPVLSFPREIIGSFAEFQSELKPSELKTSQISNTMDVTVSSGL